MIIVTSIVDVVGFSRFNVTHSQSSSHRLVVPL